MPQHVIIEKLNRELLEPIRSERQVVYILAELRKLLEITGSQGEYRSLDFHCDWAMHAKLNRAKARWVVQRFDAHERLYHQLLNDYEGPLPDWDTPIQEFAEVIGFSRFRQQIKGFCTNQQICGPLLDDDGEWLHFLRHYAAVIDSCPLICEAPEMTHVKVVTLSVAYMAESGGQRNHLNEVILTWCWRSEITGEDRVSHYLLKFPQTESGRF